MCSARLEREVEMKAKRVTKCSYINCMGQGGFTLIELLIVVAVIALLITISSPALLRVKKHVRSVLGANNQKQIVSCVTLYAFDSDDRCPESVATVGFDALWNWCEPTKLIGNQQRTPATHRALSEYLGTYISDARMMSCPNSPRQYKYLQQSWEEGDEWDNPETSFLLDPVGGTYCFYWSYIGFLEERSYPFVGPFTLSTGNRQSTLLVSDYFGYDHWRSPDSFGSCEKLRNALPIPETWLLSSYWSYQPAYETEPVPDIKLQAGYVDGHVSTWKPSDAFIMRVSLTCDGSVPYPDGVGPGLFYLPRNSIK